MRKHRDKTNEPINPDKNSDQFPAIENDELGLFFEIYTQG
jgi:hypothetical protein